MATICVLEHQEETLDRLAGEWWIVQLRKGHRYSTDDVLTAWTGICAAPQARQVLDLGSGVGSVGLMALLHLDPTAHLTSVEIQPYNVALQHKTRSLNHLEQRVDLIQGDLRETQHFFRPSGYDLVLANPPYLPPQAAIPSPYAGRTAARMELNGDVFDYCRAAACSLAPLGLFCFSHAAADPRPGQAIVQAGLTLLCRQEVVFRRGRPPVIALYTCAQQGTRQDRPQLCVRDQDGQRSEAYHRIRQKMSIDA